MPRASAEWEVLIRRYLAERDPSLLKEARAAAPDPEVAALVSAYEDRDPAALSRVADSLAATLRQAGRVEEAVTASLLAVDSQVQLVEVYNQFPMEEQLEVLRFGLEGCESAIELASSVGDIPCTAFYQFERGAGLYRLRELEAARGAYGEALELYRRLARAQPQVYEPDVAMTLNNLGTVLRDLRELEAARGAYGEALELRKEHGLRLESAETYANWGLLEEGEDHTRAVQLFEACVEHCESGLILLAEREHRDKFKARIEIAYLRLLEHYAHVVERRGDMAAPDRLAGLLESLRQVETLAGFGTAACDSIERLRVPFRDLKAGAGKVAESTGRESGALLWVHAVEQGVVFTTLTANSFSVEVAEPALLEQFADLFVEVERSMAAFGTRNPLLEAVRWTRSAVAAHIASSGEKAFRQLPKGVKALLQGDEYNTIFLAPCSRTMNLPFEMLHAGGGYLGLRRLMPRVHGLGELIRVMERRPGGKRAVVVGNPLHAGLKPLPGARTAAMALEKELRRRDFLPIPLLDGRASDEAVLEALAGDGPSVWVQMGHGGRPQPEESDGAEYLAMAGTGRLLPRQLARLRWKNHPLVHHDCCVTGTIRARGGGRFDGHPIAALLAGASCVLSSVHPLWDDTAAEFSARLYGKLLDRRKPLPVGDALLQTRCEMAEAHHNNPLVWATTVLWGNPWVRLP